MWARNLLKRFLLRNPRPFLPDAQKSAQGSFRSTTLSKRWWGRKPHGQTGKVLVIAQPDYDFLIHTLSALTLGRECSVQHILCLESESQEEDNHYNLGCLRAVVELMFSLKSYQPYYYYDNITSHFKNSNSLPYLIVTSGMRPTAFL